MKLTSRILTVVTLLSITSCLTACDYTPKHQKQTIPAMNQIDIAEAVKTLDVSTEDFESFLKNIEVSYDEYIQTLNDNNTSLETLKEDIEKTYNCTFDEYIKTVIAVNTKTVPDAKLYDVFKSKLSTLDAYIPIKELNAEKNKLVNYDVSIEIADECQDAYAFDAIAACQGDFKNYMTVLNELYGCSSVELTNISLFGGYGTKKPDDSNACMNALFVYDEETNEILQKISVPVITLHNDDDENKNITLALSNELGLLFKTTGADSYEKMLKLSNLDFQIRNVVANNDAAK